MSELKERQEMDPAYQWDLSSLFADDEEWEKSLNQLDKKIKSVSAYQGRLNTAETIHEYLAESTSLEQILSDLFSYAMMRRSEDTRQEAAQRMYAKIYRKYVQASAATAFADPEILSLPQDALQKLTDDPALSDYHFTMVRLLRQKEHTLSGAEEKLLAAFGESFAVPKEVSGSLMDADMVFDPAEDQEGQSHEVSGSSYILLQSSKDRVLRKNAFQSFYKGYGQHINTFASAYAGQVKSDVTMAAVRHYHSAREMFMEEEHIPESVYDGLIEAVRRNMPSMYRYVALRKRLLGIDDLHYYDIYAPLSDNVKKDYTYEQAKQMVLDATAPLGEKYGQIVRQGFKDRWIDVYPNKGKRGGAYSSGTYDSNPYIMSNFVGTLDSVSTIAHEMGHSMHTWFSNHAQPPQYAEYTIFVAEVASTVNENLLIEQLLKNCKDPVERLGLLNHYLEGFKGTVYRQTMFAEFEKEAHAMAERGEALNAASLNAVYRKLIEDYFGPDLTVDDEVAYEWARIPHFYSPFYVYKYATSYSMATAISEAILKEGQPAVDRYLKFLSLGGSMDPLDELKVAGVDMTTPAPVEAALKKFAQVLEEAEKTADELGR